MLLAEHHRVILRPGPETLGLCQGWLHQVSSLVSEFFLQLECGIPQAPQSEKSEVVVEFVALSAT
jgi:hypothetical protein